MYCIATGEIFQAMAYETESMLLFRVCFLGSCILAFLLNWTTFRNTTINSPLTQVVTGQAKNFIAFLLSLVVFSDYKYVVLCVVATRCDCYRVFGCLSRQV